MVYIRHHCFYLIHIQKKPISGHKDKCLRQLLPGIFMKLYNTGIQPRLIVPIHRQMPFIAPIRQLVDNAVKKFVFHPLIWTFLRIFIRRTKFTCTITTVNGLQINYQWMRNLFRIHEIIYIILLQLPSGYKLKLQVTFARQHRKILPRIPSKPP